MNTKDLIQLLNDKPEGVFISVELRNAIVGKIAKLEVLTEEAAKEILALRLENSNLKDELEFEKEKLQRSPLNMAIIVDGDHNEVEGYDLMGITDAMRICAATTSYYYKVVEVYYKDSVTKYKL